MNLPRLFKLPEYRKFSYRPLFHDPEKEAREERMRRLRAETGSDPQAQYVPSIQRGTMRSYFKRDEKVRKQSNFRLIIIIFFLLVVSYLILFR
jgi:type II secretory pathway component PulL